jgi:AraC-like DNA-binding protein
MSDRLSSLLARFQLRARVLHSGTLSSVLDLHEARRGGHLHLVCAGQLEMATAGSQRLKISEPSVLLLPRPLVHQLIPGPGAAPELVSAAIDFGPSDENPLLRGLPDLLHVPLAQWQADASTLVLVQQSLAAETAAQRCGHAAVVDRLVEVLVIQLLRHAMAQRLVDVGVIAGLADARLSRVLNALHAEPERPWTLDTMALLAGMSRARFAAHFSAALGMPPGEYLGTWRIGLARSLLRKGMSVKQVAPEVGYANASALARAFAQRLGLSPTAWLAQESRAAN